MSTVFRVGDPVIVVDASSEVLKWLGCHAVVADTEDTGIYDVGIQSPEIAYGEVTDFYDWEIAIDETRLEVRHGQV